MARAYAPSGDPSDDWICWRLRVRTWRSPASRLSQPFDASANCATGRRLKPFRGSRQHPAGSFSLSRSRIGRSVSIPFTPPRGNSQLSGAGNNINLGCLYRLPRPSIIAVNIWSMSATQHGRNWETPGMKFEFRVAASHELTRCFMTRITADATGISWVFRRIIFLPSPPEILPSPHSSTYDGCAGVS